jgi:hypothetical protein
MSNCCVRFDREDSIVGRLLWMEMLVLVGVDERG